MDTGKIINNFLVMRSANTQRRYKKALANWQSFINKNMEHGTAEEAVSYISSLEKRKLSDNSIVSEFRALRSIYGVLNDVQAVGHNPFRAARRMMKQRRIRLVRPTKMIPFELVMRIVNYGENTTENVRNRAIMALIFGGGLRRCEVFGLNTGDFFHTADGYKVYLRSTKGGDDVFQGLPDWAGEHVAAHLKSRASKFDDAAMFVRVFSNGTQDTKRLSVETIYRVYKERLRRFNIDAGPHSGRATAVSLLKESGLEDRLVAGFLRHATPAQVQTYDKRFGSELLKVAKKVRYS